MNSVPEKNVNPVINTTNALNAVNTSNTSNPSNPLPPVKLDPTVKKNTGKKVSIGILIVVVLILIGYIIYIIVAYNKKAYPFSPYTTPAPPKSFYPTGNITILEGQELVDAQKQIQAAYAQSLKNLPAQN